MWSIGLRVADIIVCISVVLYSITVLSAHTMPINYLHIILPHVMQWHNSYVLAVLSSFMHRHVFLLNSAACAKYIYAGTAL